MFPLFFLACIAIIITLNFKNLDHPIKWQFWRTVLYLSSGFFVLTANSDPASLISFMSYIAVAVLGSSVGYLGKFAGASDKSSPAEVLVFASRAPLLIVNNAWKSLSSDTSRRNWKLQVNSESGIVKFLNRLLNLENQNVLLFSFIIYIVGIGIAAILGLLFASAQLASIISSENVQMVSVRNMAVLLLMIYGPQLLLFWMGAGTLLCVVSSVLVPSGSLRNTAKAVLVQFAGSTGVGAALGLVLGIVAPGVWVQMRELGMVTESASYEAPVDGGLAITMSSVGLVIGALIGTYTSLRKGAANFSNKIYREIFVYLPLVASGIIFNHYGVASPEKLALLIADSSEFEPKEASVQKLNEEQIEQLLISMPPEDFAKVLFELDQQEFILQFDIISIVLWLAGLLCLAFIVSAVVRGVGKSEA